MVYGDIDRYDSALYYTKKSIEIDTKNNDKAGLSSSYTVVGNLFKKELLYDSAFVSLLYLQLLTQFKLNLLP